jgi:hypothetical protein
MKVAKDECAASWVIGDAGAVPQQEDRTARVRPAA